MKNENKIREYLGDKYHLNVTLGGDQLEKISWKLFKKYEGWMNDGSKPIMTSDINTDEELFDFAKKHRRYNEGKIIGITNVWISLIALLLVVLGIILKNRNIQCIGQGMNIAAIISCTIKYIISEYNFKVSKMEFVEQLVRDLKKDKNGSE